MASAGPEQPHGEPLPMARTARGDQALRPARQLFGWEGQIRRAQRWGGAFGAVTSMSRACCGLVKEVKVDSARSAPASVA
jgi:hypothetical protein